jgi:cytidylate kinase
MSAERTSGRGSARPLVTFMGLYGAGSSVIGPRVADRLDVPFLDTAIPAAVAERLGVPEEAIRTYDPDVEREGHRGRLRRFLDSLGQPATADTAPQTDETARRLRSATAAYLAEATVDGGVVLGRGGMLVLRRVPGVLHVRLEGPREARIELAMREFGFDRRTAEQRLADNDRARAAYVREWYGIDPDDPDLYHLRLDSTVLHPETCVDVIATAALSRAHEPGPSVEAGADGGGTS